MVSIGVSDLGTHVVMNWHCLISIQFHRSKRCVFFEEQWHDIRKKLKGPIYNYQLGAENSSIFTIIQKSNASPKQEGFVLAASNDPET